MKRTLVFRNIIAGVFAAAAFFGYMEILYLTLESSDTEARHAADTRSKVSAGAAHSASAPANQRTAM